MQPHYQADPDKGCGLLIISGLVVGAILVAMLAVIFGLDDWVAVLLFIAVAVGAWWLLTQISRRDG